MTQGGMCHWTQNTDTVTCRFKGHVFGLTPREVEILLLIAHGCTNRDIAATCNISERTVKNHVSKLLLRLAVNNRTQAAAMSDMVSTVPEIGRDK